ncbi:MAG TPA: hypothetical protein VMV69_23310 [Pirellulales bacterium]|nr:hypothetical protein [Pirellulales bacterium]
MIRLSDLRARLRKPITKLLHDAVVAYHRLLSESPKSGEQCCDQPRLRWRGERGNAAIECEACGFVLADDGQVEDWHDPEQIAWEAELKAEEAAMEEEASRSTGPAGIPR